MPEQEQELKPCPFCGGTDLHLSGIEQIFIGVSCNTCDCEGPSQKTKRGAIKTWNTRAVEKDEDNDKCGF